MTRNGDGDQATGGFALIVVLWFLVLIGTIGTVLLAKARSETAIARNIVAAASAEALADAGIARAAYNLAGPNALDDWRPDGRGHHLQLPGGAVTVSVVDESWKINPNLAPAIVVTALFEECGLDPGQARHLGAAIADWVGADEPPASSGDKAEQYQGTDRNDDRPGGRFASLDALALVPGMTPGILAKARPYLTIYTASDRPDLRYAPALVRRALAQASRRPDHGANDAQPARQYQANTTDEKTNGEKTNGGRIVSVQAIARSRDGGVFIRYAVLRFDAGSPKGYRVLDWERLRSAKSDTPAS